MVKSLIIIIQHIAAGSVPWNLYRFVGQMMRSMRMDNGNMIKYDAAHL
jgi:membrane-associated PAP2 superfamily phosphatase